MISCPAGGFTMGDGSFRFSINYGDLQKTVAALGYLTPDHGLTYPDMPYPLNEIYKNLKQIIENSTKEVYSEPIQRDDSVSEDADTAELTANTVHIEKGEFVRFSGHSTLADGTLLQTQLYANGQPEEWWPIEKYVEVKDKKWQINVPLNEDGTAHTFSAGQEYVFKIWERDNPTVMAVFPFDLSPPPLK